MFENFFRKKPSVDGVAHVDSSTNSPEFVPARREDKQDLGEILANEFDKKHNEEAVKKGKRNWYIDDDFTKGKVSNERNKVKLGEKNSRLGNEDLVEEPEIATKEEINDKHLDALIEVEDEGEDENWDDEHKEAA